MSLLRRLQLKHMSPSGGEPEDGQSASDRPRKTTSTGGSDKHLERSLVFKSTNHLVSLHAHRPC